MSMPSIKSREIRVSQEIPIARTLKFWNGLKAGTIYTTQCSRCGKIHFPPVADCSNCQSSDMRWIKLSDEVEIVTFTHVVIRPTSFQSHRPYTVAIGKLKEGVRVLGWLTGFKMSDVKVGVKAKLTAKIDEDGNPTYEFTPF